MNKDNKQEHQIQSDHDMADEIERANRDKWAVHRLRQEQINNGDN